MTRSTPVVASVFDVEPRFIGGTETYARELSRQLGERGDRSVLCFATPPTEDVRRFLDLPNVTIEVLNRDATPFTPQVAVRLGQIFRKHRPTIVHFHYIDLLSPYSWVARVLSASRVFFTDHGSRPEGHRPHRASPAKRYLARLVSWPVSRVICVSGYGHRSLVKRGLFPADRCRRIYNGVDLGRVAPSRERAAQFRRRFAIPDGRSVVVQVSWIIPEKGIADLLDAARIVVDERPESHFVIVGEGASRSEYMARGRELGLEGHVTWTGLVEDPFSAGVYDAADIVCQASRWEEVFGWVIAEAMAYGLPVIGTRVGGVPEVVSDRETGFLVDRGDAKALARQVLALIADPAIRTAMGAAGREKVHVRFDLRQNVRQLIEAYGLPTSAMEAEPAS